MIINPFLLKLTVAENLWKQAEHLTNLSQLIQSTVPDSAHKSVNTKPLSVQTENLATSTRLEE